MNVQERSRAIDASLNFPRVVARTLADLTRRQQEECKAMPTPFDSLNSACRGSGGGMGLGPGWFCVITAPTGVGKTLLALNFSHSAQQTGASVAFVSLELSSDEILTRYRAIVSGTDIKSIEQGAYFQPAKAEEANQALLNLPGSLYLNPEPIAELQGIAGAIEELARSDGVRLLIVDYAQLVTTAGRDSDLFARMAEVSAELRVVARRTGVAVIALSQLNRARERGAPASIENLFGSSRFGFDADLVLALDFTGVERNEIRRTQRLKLRTLKARHGPAVTIPIEFSTANFRFRELEPDEGGVDRE